MSVLGRCIQRSLVPVCGLLIRFSTVQNTHVIHVDYVAPLNIKRNSISCCIIMNAIQSINLTACDWGQAWVTLERPETGKRTPRALEDNFAVRTMEQWAGERRVLIFITEAIPFNHCQRKYTRYHSRVKGPVFSQRMQHFWLLYS